MASPDVPMPVRIISAALGSLLTAVVLTPLDVAKTRQQLASTSLAAGSELSRKVTLGPARPSAPSTLSIIVSVAQKEGAIALWSGFAPSMVLALPSAVLYYAAYDEMRDRLRAGAPHGSAAHSLAPVLAGMGGRAITAAVVSPLELLRTRTMMGRAASSSGGVEESALAAIRREVAIGGPAALWRGLLPTLWRDVPFSGIYWLSYERSKAALTQRALAQNRSATHRRGTTSDFASASPAVAELPFWEAYAVAFASGTGAGALAATITTPFDVVKTLAQTPAPAAATGGASTAAVSSAAAIAALSESSVSAACGCAGGIHGSLSVCGGRGPGAPAMQLQRTPGTGALIAGILRSQGPRGLFVGLPARVAKVAPACAIMISSYEAGKRVFAAQSER